MGSTKWLMGLTTWNMGCKTLHMEFTTSGIEVKELQISNFHLLIVAKLVYQLAVSYSSSVEALNYNFLFGNDPAWPAIIINPARHIL